MSKEQFDIICKSHGKPGYYRMDKWGEVYWYSAPPIRGTMCWWSAEGGAFRNIGYVNCADVDEWKNMEHVIIPKPFRWGVALIAVASVVTSYALAWLTTTVLGW